MMINDIKHTKNPKCKFNNTGYCKFGEKCRRRHFSHICQIENCNQNCQSRHPRLCRMESNCRFFKKGICAYKHIHPDNHGKVSNELDTLKKEIIVITKVLEQKQEQINKITTENRELIRKLHKENCDMKKLIEEIKQSNKKALEAKDSEILILKEQIKAQKQEIKEIVPKEQSGNSNIVDRSTDSKKKVIAVNIDDNPNVGGDFMCDKCAFSISSLSLLVKHKANEHKPFMICDKCDFKTMKRSEFQLHSVFAH